MDADLHAELAREKELLARRQALQAELERMRAERRKLEMRERWRAKKARQRARAAPKARNDQEPSTHAQGEAAQAPMAPPARAKARPRDTEGLGNLGGITDLLPGMRLPPAEMPAALAEVPGFIEAWDRWLQAAQRKGGKLSKYRKRLILNTVAQQPRRAMEAAKMGGAKGWRDFDWGWMNGPQNTPQVPNLLAELERHKAQAEALGITF